MVATTKPAPVAWTAAHGPWNVLPAMAPLNSIGRVVLAGSIVAACLLAHAASAAPAGVATAPTCRELERRLDLIKPEAKSTELNLVLFAAADSGCLPLARRLLDAGASLAARDRLGAMALARAARAGHVALVDFLVAQGAPHRRAQSRRRDRALRRGRERAAGQRCGAADEACRSEPCGPIGRHPACGGRLQGQRSHRRSAHRRGRRSRMSWTRPARRR